MIYRLVGSVDLEEGIVPSSGYPYEMGCDAVCVSSDYPPDFVTRLVTRIVLDFNNSERYVRRRYYYMEMSEFAEVLRDFFGFDVLDCDPASVSEGMTVCPWGLCGRFWAQSRHLIQNMHVFDRDGLRERLAEIYRSVKDRTDQ